YGSSTCAALETEELFLGTGSVLSFDAKYDIENSYDKGEVQISDNGGVSWQRLEVGYPGTSTNASDNCGLPTGTYFTGTGQDVNYLPYSVDLSSYSNQFVHIRFLLSTDGSVPGDGWWIDNIDITNVDVPGTCVTGSGCEDNPFVSITPGGTQNVCASEGKVLTAQTTGGTPPFLYQWMRDGVDIPGEVSEFLDVDDTGTHTYSVRVRSLACEDFIFGAGAAALTFLDSPEFAGLQDVSPADDTTCSLDLAWSPATTSCSGPINYTVYRDTVSPVSIDPANIVASGVSGTAFTDSDSLVEGQNYFYVVKAVDSSTGEPDANTTEQGGQPTSPDNGNQIFFFNGFDSPTEFAAWSATTGPGNHTCAAAAWTESASASQRP
ncbi:MAG: hypothetical protein GY708_16735, partial [Actinomycetia bacterium]|nr:hypothetical protein [Actinomycetes bacterium]